MDRGSDTSERECFKSVPDNYDEVLQNEDRNKSAVGTDERKNSRGVIRDASLR